MPFFAKTGQAFCRKISRDGIFVICFLRPPCLFFRISHVVRVANHNRKACECMIKKFFLSALLWMTALSFAGCQAVSASSALSNPASSSAFSGSSAVRSPAVSSSGSFSFRNARQHPLRRDDVGPVRLSARNRREPSEAVYRSVRCSQLCTAVRQQSGGTAAQQSGRISEPASAETIDILAEGCGNVDFAAREILSNGVDGVADILNDAGNPNQYDEYDPEKYEAVAGILKETLAAYT